MQTLIQEVDFNEDETLFASKKDGFETVYILKQLSCSALTLIGEFQLIDKMNNTHCKLEKKLYECSF